MCADGKTRRRPEFTDMFHVKQLSTPLSAKAVQDRLHLADEALLRLEAFVDILRKWQLKTNLVSKAGMADVWCRHILDSAQLHSLVPGKSRIIVDLGSGAGFPGMILAIVGGYHVHLIESDTRKCSFLREANRITAAGATIHNTRIERIPPFRADVVTARALAPLCQLLSFASPFLTGESVCLFLKGGKADGELTKSLKNWTMQVSRTQSLSDPSGEILLLKDIARHHGR